MAFRVPRQFAAGVVLVFASACGGSQPTAPERVSPAPASAITVTPTQYLFGHGGTDLAVCLSGAADAGCFTPVRVVARAAATAPGTPGNLTATVQGGTVTFAWSAPPGDPATSYFLEA